MAKIIVPGWDERSGDGYWSDRMEVMKSRDDQELEREKMLLFDVLMAQEGPIIKMADLGCGIGRRHVQYPGLEYTGFDREAAMVQEASRRFPELKFHHCDGQTLCEEFPQYEGHFDLVTTYHVLQYNHVEQQREIIKGSNLLLRPGGYAYVKENTIYAHNNDGLYADLGSEDSLNGCSYTQAGWERVFKDAGFGLVATDGEHGHFIFKKR